MCVPFIIIVVEPARDQGAGEIVGGPLLNERADQRQRQDERDQEQLFRFQKIAVCFRVL